MFGLQVGREKAKSTFSPEKDAHEKRFEFYEKPSLHKVICQAIFKKMKPRDDIFLIKNFHLHDYQIERLGSSKSNGCILYSNNSL